MRVRCEFYRWRPNSQAPAARASAAGLALPDKPSIAVLPFQNISGDPEQNYFADGMVEDIITGLSRIKWLFVIARNSSFIYKGKAVQVKQVRQELGVRYVLEGSVRKAADRVRITGQLIDAATGTHVWAERYDRKSDDIFALQDEITLSVVGAIEPSLRLAEIERVKRKRSDSLDAYDLVLQAQPEVYSRLPELSAKALVLLEKALALDPDYALAHAYAAECLHSLHIRGGSVWNIAPPRSVMPRPRWRTAPTTRPRSLSPALSSAWTSTIGQPHSRPLTPSWLSAPPRPSPTFSAASFLHSGAKAGGRSNGPIAPCG